MQAQFIVTATINTLHKRLWWMLVVFLLVLGKGRAQDFPPYDEIMVEMNVPELGLFDVSIAIKGEEAYLSVAEVFDILGIKQESDSQSQVITGFILNPENHFTIQPASQMIVAGEEEFPLSSEDYILTPMDFYLRADLFEPIFDLQAEFNFRNLSVTLETSLELPVIRNRRLEQMRSNITQLRGEVEPDTTLQREFQMLRGTAVDWGIITTQQSNGVNENRFNLGLGGMFAGGEANVLLNYSDRIPFVSRNQFYQWRYVNNRNKLFRQVSAGKINTRATSTLYAPVVGVQFTNTPLMNRRSYGTYTLSDFTEPGWTVELYVNNVLVDYVEADASGFYKFEVPLMYGQTHVNLRFYGPWGEERTQDQVINIPYNFIPKNELEYTFSAGVVENVLNSKFARFELNYGLGTNMTVGGGLEYLSTLERGERVMPFLATSVNLTTNLLFSGTYTHGVKAEGLMSYRTQNNLQIDLNYINYNKDQEAINYNYLEERKLSLSMPVRTSFLNAYARMSVHQIVLPNTDFTTAQALLSGSIWGINTNLTTFALFNDRLAGANIYSSLSQSYRLPNRFLLIPRVQFDWDEARVNNVAARVERQVFGNGYMNIGYEKNFWRDVHTFELGLRYTFNFGQASANARVGNHINSFMQSARGGLFWDDRNGHIAFNERSNVGKAAVVVVPFLDLNRNGQRDPMEPPVEGLQLKSGSGRQQYSKDGTQIRIYDLEPYVPTVLELDPISLDNIAWRINDLKVQLEPLPNQFNVVHVPVEVLGEVSGMVYLEEGNQQRGLGRILVSILNEQGQEVAQLLSEGDGYFFYLGLAPGTYRAVIDADQLERLNMTASPRITEFEIKVDEFGDIVDTLEFVLEKDGI